MTQKQFKLWVHLDRGLTHSRRQEHISSLYSSRHFYDDLLMQLWLILPLLTSDPSPR